jgi:hypothetical protein
MSKGVCPYTSLAGAYSIRHHSASRSVQSGMSIGVVSLDRSLRRAELNVAVIVVGSAGSLAVVRGYCARRNSFVVHTEERHGIGRLQCCDTDFNIISGVRARCVRPGLRRIVDRHREASDASWTRLVKIHCSAGESVILSGVACSSGVYPAIPQFISLS